jgi:hypothetical protein
MKSLLFQKINTSNGINTVDLALFIMSKIGPAIFNYEPFTDALKELINEYAIRVQHYRVRGRDMTMFYPSDTVFY